MYSVLFCKEAAEWHKCTLSVTDDLSVSDVTDDLTVSVVTGEYTLNVEDEYIKLVVND